MKGKEKALNLFRLDSPIRQTLRSYLGDKKSVVVYER